MAVTADRVIVDLEARVDAYNRRVTGAERKFDQSMGRIRRSARLAEQQTTRSFAGIGRGFAGLLATAGGVVAVRRFTRSIRDTVSEMDRLANTADKLGVDAEALQEFRFAAEQSGVAIRTFDMALQRFGRRAAEAARDTGEAKDALEQLNVQLRDSEGQVRDVESLFMEAAEALSEVENRTERLALAFKLFDSEGVAVLNMVDNLRELRQEARDLGIVLANDLVRDAQRFEGQMNRITSRLSATWRSMVITMLTEWNRLLGIVSVTPITGQFGEVVKELGEVNRQIREIESLPSGVMRGPGDTGQGAELERLKARRDELRKQAQTLKNLRNAQADLNEVQAAPSDVTLGGGGGGGAAGADLDVFQQELASLAERRAALQAVLAAQEQLNPVMDDYAVAAEAAAIEARLLAAAEEAGVDASRDQIAALARSTAELEERAAAADQFGARVDSIKAETAAIEAETEALRGVNPALNDYGLAVETALAEQELMNLAIQAGIPLTTELRDAIEQLAGGYGAAAAEANRLAAEQRAVERGADDFKRLSRNVFGDFIQGVRDGKDAVDILADALDQIGAKLLDLSLNAIFDTGGGPQALTGFLGALGGAFGFDRGGPTGGRRGQPAGIVHGEEYVVRAGPAQKFRPLLEQINEGRRLPGFQHGGFVASAPSMNIPDVGRRTTQQSSGGEQNISVKMDVHGVTDADSFRRSEPQMMADLQRKLSNVARRGTA